MPGRQAKLDELKRLTAVAVLEEATMAAIRAKSLANLDRWNANGVWVSAHDEWRALMTSETDAQIIATMSGRDENSNRLRQSAPYVGLIDPHTRLKLMKQVGLKPPSKKAAANADRVLAELENESVPADRPAGL
jgi:hypothetical protein